MRFASTIVPLISYAALVAADRHVVGSSLDARDDTARHVVGAPADVFRRAACNADNCARAVTGTFRGAAISSQRLQDCSSFFALTVTPATVTSTVTVTPSPVTVSSTSFTTSTLTIAPTSTIDVEVYNSNKKRAANGAVTVSPTAVPAYASACSGISRYSSACSCAGVTASYTTVAAPTTTVTVTAVPSTTTVQTVATATATAGGVYQDQIPCGQTVAGPADGFPIAVICEATLSGSGVSQVSTTTVGDWDQCLSLADNTFACTSFTYQLATRQCTLYHDTGNAFASTPATGMIYAYFPQ